MVHIDLDPFGIFHTLFSEHSPYRGLTLSSLTILVMWVLYKLSTHAIKKYTTEQRAFNEEHVLFFLRTWRYAWVATIGILAVISLSGSLSALGLSAGFFGMMLGWSLQAPVTGIAASRMRSSSPEEPDSSRRATGRYVRLCDCEGWRHHSRP